MKKLLCLMGGAMLVVVSYCQKISIEPFYIGDRVPDIQLNNIVNYKDSIINLSHFGDKMVILDFWNIHCGSCIKMFAKEDSIQQLLKQDIQFLLVTTDKKEDVEKFIEKYNKIHARLPFPIVIRDKSLRQLFRFKFVPHYVWIAPNGLILAQTSDNLINKEAILKALAPFRVLEKRLKGLKSTNYGLHMQPPSQELSILLNN
ncbi:TlpA family protein disulfide reductase [Arachidicoccus ginsenosidivorans]|uniref:TlpA family protein disulfide reductase n=1 Tax=Arachidicoccus ginsenosidivorans TaxID=496057 RepID=UPI001315113B|nr:redoxin domain-containing protein [Arachidicoccus ginsenosidivorans]